MEDERIVALYWARDEDAIRETERKFGAYLGKIAFNILADREDSLECVNDTYLASWNSMPEHRPKALSAYLSKIVRQFAIDVLRRRSSKKRIPSVYIVSLSELGELFSTGVTPEVELDGKLLDEAVRCFVLGLPDQARQVFLGRYYFFDSVKDIAAYCGVSESKVKTLLHRTRQKLRDHLRKEGFDL